MNRAPAYCVLTERQVGIGSAAAALEPYLKPHPAVTWADVTYAGNGLLERLPLPQRVRGTLRGYRQTGAALHRGEYDALFFLTHNPAVFRQREMAKTPSVLWTDVTPALLDRQAEQYGHPVTRARLIQAAKHAAVKSCFQRAAACVGWSEWARRSFVADYGVAAEKTAVVAPGVDLTRWTMPERRASSGKPRLLFVGGDFARKGGDLLLDVFRGHLQGRSELDIVTRDPVPEQTGVRVHRGLTPKSPELLALYHAADIFVLPTRGDCFSIASIEAMATGLPVLVSDVGGISDIVDVNRTGQLIPVGAGAELRAALEALLDDPGKIRDFGLAGRAKAEQVFDAKSTAERLLSMLERVAREARRERRR